LQWPGSEESFAFQRCGCDIQLKKVETLQAKNPHKPEKWMKHNQKATWLAYNRRVDIVLEPQGQQSTEAYPDSASAARVLWASKEPSLKRVEQASKTSLSVAQAHTHPAGK